MTENIGECMYEWNGSQIYITKWFEYGIKIK